MKKTNIKERIKNVYEAFFEESHSRGEHDLVYVSNNSIREIEEESEVKVSVFGELKGDQLITILRRLFLFLPGVALLFPATLFTFERFFVRELGVFRILMVLPWLLLFGLMVMFGISRVRDPKNLLIPISVVAVAFFVFLVSLLMGEEAGWSFLVNYSVYFFPIAFVVPVLVKDWIENKTQ